MILNNKLIGPAALGLLLFSACQQEDAEYHDQEVGSEEITTLPMHSLVLTGLDDFQPVAENWSVAGGVQSHYETEHSMEVLDGDGVLLNQPSESQQDNIFTSFEHGDIELKLEFLVPRGSNSGIYFQGRYEVQILDSWGVSDPQFTDVGGIYERWDETRPDGERGFEGVAPRVNAGLAPGLWQEYHILFRAPRFNEDGEKTQNARFEWVYLNGTRVQENAEVTGPTRASAFDDETDMGPLMLQGDHGPVAFRNIYYKTYSQTDSLTLSEMEYQVYDYDGDRTPVNFDELELLEEGVTDSFNVSELGPKNEHYATRFSGELNVPVTGDYLFQTEMSNGGNLFINGDLIIENTGEFDEFRPGRIIHLTEGSHQIELTHFQIMWGTHAIVFYEGPQIERRTLGSEASGSGGTPSPRVLVQPETEYPELIGGFVNYGGEKRTHILTVGHPEGVHYSYDLNRASLLKFWRDPFADVTQMWQGRGHEQLLVPLNAAVEESAGIPVALSGSIDAFENHKINPELEVREYHLDENGRPIFTSRFGDIDITDKIEPSESQNRLTRYLTFASESSSSERMSRIAQSPELELLSNGLFRVNGNYYLRIEETSGEEPEIIENDGVKTLFIPILRESGQSEIQYQLIW